MVVCCQSVLTSLGPASPSPACLPDRPGLRGRERPHPLPQHCRHPPTNHSLAAGGAPPMRGRLGANRILWRAVRAAPITAAEHYNYGALST